MIFIISSVTVSGLTWVAGSAAGGGGGGGSGMAVALSTGLRLLVRYGAGDAARGGLVVRYPRPTPKDLCIRCGSTRIGPKTQNATKMLADGTDALSWSN